MKKINCILLIDDNPADNVFHKIQIKKSEVCDVVQVAIDGEEGINYLKKASDPSHGEAYPKPDIIFLDINMPKMNGFEFLEEYKNIDHTLKSTVVIVMLTTSLNPDDKQRAVTYTDIKEFQNKPLTVKSLGEIIEKYF